ncbi:putative nuclease HARBI1 [Acanthochromis polyacanthus]|uniref:putative nuclease HARBI1 n=1 Tax=Acanthochromis polyacanthus TaxID=80966 RepID=UPI002233EF4E|nr:putative nuclease HARBI1 [Acanthochromis polyacanthus]
MACPFIDEEPVDVGAAIIHRAFNLPAPRHFRDRTNPLAFPEEYLWERYRFSRPGIVYLCTLLEPHIVRPTRRSRALTTVQSVCIGLRFFASGSFLYSVGDAEALSKATVCREIRRVYVTLKTYLNRFVTFPGHLEPQRIKEEFYSIAGFPNVLGAIDCTHICIRAPSGPAEADFVNQKSFHSINVQMICDGRCLITNIEAKWPGSVHDERIWRASSLSHRFAQGDFNGILLGDRGYPCLPFLLTPYMDPATDPQRAFNRAHARTRARVEMLFGLMKSRFQCLKVLRVAPDRACDIIVACAVLHNIATIRSERVPHVLDEEGWDDIIAEPQEPVDGQRMRDLYTATYFS